ncbi:hypothetical protein DTO212C5_3395 [Paecilomyces variotii]|nr:hypothetical protein DTO212C5_3395 [Paecilomyces variotii]
MSNDRTAWRNVFIYDGSTGTSLGGVRQNGSITEAVFLWMLTYVLLPSNHALRVISRTTQQPLFPTNSPLRTGDYDVYSPAGNFTLTGEVPASRIISHSVSGREESFRDDVRKRDQGCVLSGTKNTMASFGQWRGFEAAHIFPLEKELLWIKEDCQRWITDIDDERDTKINSPQNGLLLRADIHSLFDDYLVSVNPDDNYRITAFDTDWAGLDGRILDPACRDPAHPHRACDQLLQWHFRQAVLANMKGAGEPIFEHDFPPGTDMVREIREGPRAKERFELELASRLHGYTTM